MRTICLRYKLAVTHEFVFDEAGGLVAYHEDELDLSDDGQAIESALAGIYEAGFNVQADISDEFDRKYSAHWLEEDGCAKAKAQGEWEDAR